MPAADNNGNNIRVLINKENALVALFILFIVPLLTLYQNVSNIEHNLEKNVASCEEKFENHLNTDALLWGNAHTQITELKEANESLRDRILTSEKVINALERRFALLEFQNERPMRRKSPSTAFKDYFKFPIPTFSHSPCTEEVGEGHTPCDDEPTTTEVKNQEPSPDGKKKLSAPQNSIIIDSKSIKENGTY